ncbi:MULTISPECIES: hypothetical protein [Bacillus cereus group]|uniref:hypothetical protein n=1 Tax=Bacillus cereus group TaxID=86661 RepID=UPI001E2D0170|nr:MULTISPECIES: hypothetical protein [Bacillus cereus group]MCC2414298.1 hypothetical protein [Bacillus paranthracis]MDX5923214.1 hypothetical protein [Bacillus cereus group sp. BfR-BA-01033]MDX5975774.1 hypothetical protein [Bacillus cereus group sp. BfR-BA-00287]
MKEKVWLVRPLPHGTNHMMEFLNHDFIAVGYPVGKNLKGFNYEEIREILEKHDYVEGIGNVNTFVNSMNPGDIVVVPADNKKDVFFAEIISDYTYKKEFDEDVAGSGYPHHRRVQWFFDKSPLLRSELPKDLQNSMRYPGAIADFTKYREVIKKILMGNKVLNIQSLEEKALKVIEELLDSEDSTVRLKAAEIILKR